MLECAWPTEGRPAALPGPRRGAAGLDAAAGRDDDRPGGGALAGAEPRQPRPPPRALLSDLLGRDARTATISWTAARELGIDLSNGGSVIVVSDPRSSPRRATGAPACSRWSSAERAALAATRSSGTVGAVERGTAGDRAVIWSRAGRGAGPPRGRVRAPRARHEPPGLLLAVGPQPPDRPTRRHLPRRARGLSGRQRGRATGLGRSSRSRRPAPTGCCCRRWSRTRRSCAASTTRRSPAPRLRRAVRDRAGEDARDLPRRRRQRRRNRPEALHPPPHVRYRLERVRELTGLDVELD